MNEEFEKLLKENEKLKRKILALGGIKSKEAKPSYPFSRIRVKDLKKLFNLKRKLYNKNIFKEWLEYDLKLSEDDMIFLEKLLEKEKVYLDIYKEENLKMKFISQILNRVDFVINDEIRDFYDEKLLYETDKFILNGETDFMVAKGLEESEKPYFFIQEFKQNEEYGNPRPQLLAELISAIELNGWKTIKGAYIIGVNWNFVILEKLGEKKYQYFISEKFNSSKIDELKAIYKNLLFIKAEVIKMVDTGI